MGRSSRWVAVVVAAVVACVVGPVVVAGPPPAGAAVEHGQGFAAVVDGWRSWYGSYRLGEEGEVWCVDHGIAAPDVALGYVPTGLEDHAVDTRRALAWAVGRYGVGVDRVGAAALMLVLHDLMGARYPSGPLVVESLSVDRLQGFEGHEAEVLERARSIKADAVARAGSVGPLRLEVETASPADVVVAGRSGELRARVVDANGVGVAGVSVHPAVEGAELVGEVDRTTDADGGVVWPFVAGPGSNTFELTAAVPGAELLALRPTVAAAQRVAKPSVVTLVGRASFEGVVPRQVVVRKRGDAEPDLPVAGARFRLSGVDGDLVVGADGTTPPVSVAPGVHELTEVEAPPGYEVGGPWSVTVNDADVLFDVDDVAVRGTLAIEKLDAATGAALDGAVFEVTDARSGAVLDDWTGPLRPGRYSIRELTPPPHHRRSAEVREAMVEPGKRTVVQVPNVGLSTVAFEKHPALAGATFAVTVADAEAGRCTTGVDGRCSLPDDVLEAGSAFCWTEPVAPTGWQPAAGGCTTAGPAGTTTTVTVDELPDAAPPTVEAAASPPIEEPPTAPPLAVAPAPPIPAAAEPAPTPARATTVLAAPPVAALPRTGAGTRRLAGLALVLLGVGTALLLAARRRREAQPSGGSQLVG